VNPLYLQTLRSMTVDRPYLDVALTDVTQAASFPRVEGGFDTVVCLNVIEHVADDLGAMKNIGDVLSKDGRAVILVPNGPGMFGTLDEVLGHKRRYTEATLRKLVQDAGLEVERIVRFNRVGWPAWWLNGKLLRRRVFGLLQIKFLNLLTPLFRLVDRVLPFPPLSLIAIARHPAPVAPEAVAAEAAFFDRGGRPG
jgi:SAM-dependent methyltransferase